MQRTRPPVRLSPGETHMHMLMHMKRVVCVARIILQ
jgi:hypothetical protein